MSAKALEARARSSPETVDALIVVADDERVSVSGDQLDQAFLGEVQVLVLIDKHARKARAVGAAESGLFLEELDRQSQQILEIEQSLLAASAFVRAEKTHTGLHELHALSEIRVSLIAMHRRGPGDKSLQWDELLLQTLEHLERRRHQIVRALVACEHGIAQRPHQLAGEDPALGAGKNPEAGRHPDQPAVLAQPAKRDRMEGAHGGRGFTDEALDSLAHLGRRPVGECHHQDR